MHMLAEISYATLVSSDVERLGRTGALVGHSKQYVANTIVEMYLLGYDNEVMKLLESKQP